MCCLPYHRDGFTSIEVHGLSIQDCPGTAINLARGSKLLISDSQLMSNNRKGLAQDGGGAVRLTDIGQVCNAAAPPLSLCMGVSLDDVNLALLASHPQHRESMF